MKISVIVPVYKVEKYIDRCLESIINQTYKNLEIILVDDGSPDNCPKLCDEWKKKDERVRVIHKVNGGLGEARNSGMEIATGDYITFVDSDDWIHLEAYAEIIHYLTRYELDVLSFGSNRATDSTLLNPMISALNEGYYGRKEIHNIVLPNAVAPDRIFDASKIIYKSAWSHVYKTQFLKKYGIKFLSEKEVTSEDFCFNIEVYLKMNSFYMLHKLYYYYYNNDESLTQIYRFEKYYSDYKLYENYEKNLKGAIDDVLLQKKLSLLWIQRIYARLTDACRKSTNLEYRMVRKNMITLLTDNMLIESLPNINTKNWSLKEKAVLWLIKIKSPFLFFYAYRIVVRK